MESRPRLLAQVRTKIRLKHYFIRTEQTYVDWIKSGPLLPSRFSGQRLV
jgi:hypothetical protein